MRTIDDYQSENPDYIPPILNTEFPNQSIFLWKDSQYSIKTKEKDVKVHGNIEFQWFPYAGVFFEGKTETFEHLMDEEENFSIVTEDGQILKEAFLIQEGNESFEYYIKGIISLECMKGDAAIAVNEIRFVVPNMRRIDGMQIKYKSGGSYLGRILLLFDDKEIVIDKLPDFKQRDKELQKVGGYHITHSGRITFKKAKTLKDFERERDVLNSFLQILNGKQVSGLFFSGMHENKVIWQDFRNYAIESYHQRGSSCFPFFLKKSDIDSLRVLYKNLEEFWKKEDQKTMIKSAISWYLEANTKPWYHSSTSVIISQSALEMFFNWIIVEKEGIIKGKVNLSAANKIRLLLSHIGVSNEVPEGYIRLQEFIDDPKNGNEEDSVDAVVLYRNAIVHGEYEKRLRLQTLSGGFKDEAKHLSIWHLELCLLYVLGYRGNYMNRTNSIYVTDNEIVPWEQSKDR